MFGGKKLGENNTKEVDASLKTVNTLLSNHSKPVFAVVQGNPTNLPGAELPSPEQHPRNSSLLQTAPPARQLRGQRRLPASQDRYLFVLHFRCGCCVLSLPSCVCHLRSQRTSTVADHTEVECGALLNVRVSQRFSESPATRPTD